MSVNTSLFITYTITDTCISTTFYELPLLNGLCIECFGRTGSNIQNHTDNLLLLHTDTELSEHPGQLLGGQSATPTSLLPQLDTATTSHIWSNVGTGGPLVQNFKGLMHGASAIKPMQIPRGGCHR